MGIKKIYYIIIFLLVFLTGCQSTSKMAKINIDMTKTEYDQTFYLSNERVLYCPTFNPDSGAFVAYADKKNYIVMKDVIDFGTMPNGGFCVDKNNNLYMWNSFAMPLFNYTIPKKQELIASNVFSAGFGEKFFVYIDTNSNLCLAGEDIDKSGTTYTFYNPKIIANNATSFSVYNETIIWVDENGDLFGIGKNIEKLLSNTNDRYLSEKTKLISSKKITKAKINQNNIVYLCEGKLCFWGSLKAVNEQEALVASKDEQLVLADSINMFDSSYNAIVAIDASNSSYLWGEFYDKTSISREKITKKSFINKKVSENSKHVSISDDIIMISDFNGKTSAYGYISAFSGIGNSYKSGVTIGIEDLPCIWK